MCLQNSSPAGRVTRDKTVFVIFAPSKALAEHIGRKMQVSGSASCAAISHQTNRSLRMRVFFYFMLLLLVFPLAAWAEGQNEPQLVSFFPVGGQQGTRFELRIQGQHLEGAYGVWLDCESLQGKVQRVEGVELPAKQEQGKKASPPKKGQQVVLDLSVGRSAEVGAHSLRLVTPQGVTGPLVILVHSEPAIGEGQESHSTAAEAQQITFPSVVHGNVRQSGEADYYAFDVSRGQPILFEILTGSGLLAGTPVGFLDPELVLYKASGSWFDPQRTVQLETQDESRYFYRTGQHRLVQQVYLFPEAGRYLARVGSLEGLGGPEYSYELRLAAAPPPSGLAQGNWFPYQLAHADLLAWQERDFAGKIEGNRLERLWDRTVRIASEMLTKPVGSEVRSVDGAGQTSTTRNTAQDEPRKVATPLAHLNPVVEKEPNETPEQAAEITLPSILEGAIERPGDADFFKFQVKAGEKLAFEIETPVLSHPYFSPWLEVSETAGRELVSNLFREVNGNSLTWKKSIQTKTLLTFEKAGEYYLKIRDLTSQRGEARFQYRVLIRSQVPHVGAVAAKTGESLVDHLNLRVGEAKKLFVVTEQEEGFAGEVALSVENLPPGVQALSAALVEDKRLTQTVGMFGAIHQERHLPERWLATIVLLASADAPATSQPCWVQLTARPVVEGKFGKSFGAQRIPLMVLKPAVAGQAWDGG